MSRGRDAHERQGMEALRATVRRGDMVGAKELLDDASSGARLGINRVDDEGSSVLHLAIGTKQVRQARVPHDFAHIY